ncbi:ras-related protein Rab-8A isoform X1 [Ixodes scapularis]
MDSFNHLSYWFRNVEENASPEVVKVLVGNKCDATHIRQIEKERGEKMAESFDIPFFECSCKQNINIQEAFVTLARKIREQREQRVIISPLVPYSSFRFLSLSFICTPRSPFLSFF